MSVEAPLNINGKLKYLRRAWLYEPAKPLRVSVANSLWISGPLADYA